MANFLELFEIVLPPAAGSILAEFIAAIAGFNPSKIKHSCFVAGFGIGFWGLLYIFGMCRLCIFLNTQKGINSSARICSAANWFLELIAVNLYLGMVVCFELLQKPACDF
jgi:hypothetical protein